tara:strand:+ start:1690 stop:2004 length:315 start_codon:yes stop_codon:yes gene_type:complete
MGTYNEEDIKEKIEQMKRNGCLPAMIIGDWELYDDAGQLQLRVHSEESKAIILQCMIDENYDQAFTTLEAFDCLTIAMFTLSVAGASKMMNAHKELLEDEDDDE